MSPNSNELNRALLFTVGYKFYPLLTQYYQVSKATKIYKTSIDNKCEYNIQINFGSETSEFTGHMQVFNLSDKVKIYADYKKEIDILFIGILITKRNLSKYSHN
jgi:hypothetical protein